ncbi:MAG: TRAP transporter substrate-binding protein DctP [Hyphomicrobiaceae bacterium]
MKLSKLLAASAAGAMALSMTAGLAVAQQKYRLEISLETGPNHLRNISIMQFAEELQKRSGGRLEVKVFHGASKYKGTNVPTALAQGALDMGLPGTWQLGKFIPDFDSADLPIFYGVKRKDVYKVWDGPVGKEIVAKLEKKLGVKVVGRWMDLGPGQNFFTKKKVATAADLKGLKVRTPGDAANGARYETLAAIAIKIAWPDVPQALQRGTIDGLFTTFESTRSAKLWDSGVRYSYENDQNFLQYIPMIGLKTWNKYPKDIQELIVKVWEEKIDSIREFGAKRQASARADCAKAGIQIIVASDADRAATRAILMKKQPELVKKLKIDPAFVAKIEKVLGK